MTTSAIEIIEKNLANQAKTIHKENYEKNFTTLSNEACQIRFNNDKLPSAKEVYLYLLSLPDDWQISTENVAKHFDTSKKYMQQLFDIIIANDCMIALQLRKKSGRFGGIIYKVFQSPGVVSRPPVKIDDNQSNNLEINDKSPGVVSRPPATYYKQKTKTKDKQQNSDSNFDCNVVVFHFDKKIESALNENPDIKREWIDESLKLPDQNNENIILAIEKSKSADRPIAFIREALKKGWIFENKEKIKHVDIREKAKKDQNEFEKSLDYEPISVEEMRRIRTDNNKRQSLTRSRSIENQPINQHNNYAIKDESFLGQQPSPEGDGLSRRRTSR